VTRSGTASSADRAGNSDALENLARVGLIAYGIVHLLIAWLALQLAWSGGGESADQSGALATLAEKPFGKPLLWVLALGLLALALWQLGEVLRHRAGLQSTGDARKKAVTKIVKSVAKAIMFLALAVLAFRYATGGGQSGSGQQQTVSGVFAWPGGRFLVGVAALVIIGVGVYLVRKGITKSFLKEIDTAQAPANQQRLIERLGQVGYPAKGVAIALVGGLLGWAAITFDPAKATGLDGALRTVLDAPFGKWLLTLVALGIAAYGVFLFFRARFPQRT
jgi:large-conductance mechanosensitive channel